MSSRLMLMFGPPNAGKGTYGRRISRKAGIPYVCAGEAIRERLREDEGWFQNRYSMEMHDQGKFCPADLVRKLVFDLVENVKGPCVLDGYPRNLSQLEDLVSLGIPCTMIHLDIPEEELVRRAAGRMICEECGEVYNTNNPHMQPGKGDSCVVENCGGNLFRRGDDEADIVRDRIRKYEQDTRPVLDACQNIGVDVLHFSPDGQCVDDQTDRLIAMLDIDDLVSTDGGGLKV